MWCRTTSPTRSSWSAPPLRAMNRPRLAFDARSSGTMRQRKITGARYRRTGYSGEGRSMDETARYSLMTNHQLREEISALKKTVATIKDLPAGHRGVAHARYSTALEAAGAELERRIEFEMNSGE